MQISDYTKWGSFIVADIPFFLSFSEIVKAERSTLCGHGFWEAERERERETEREKVGEKEKGGK